MKKPVIIVPTYWSKGHSCQDDLIYDHPTDLLDPIETISKTLKSFECIQGEFDVVVIGCPTRASIGEEMDRTVKKIIKNLSLPFKIKYFGAAEYKKLKSYISQEITSKLSNLISNMGYGNVRNLCLLIPHFLDSDIAILIDDDEFVTDESFLEKAIEFIGSVIEGKVLGLIVGFYVNTDNSPLLDDSNIPWWNLVWEKEKLMNEAFQIITNPELERLVETPFAFGGNIVVHRSCWEQVPFDPLITRGEDMDYLRSVKYFGFNAKLDRLLSITHDPPRTKTSSIQKFRQDIHRFLYSSYKLEYMNLDLAEFDPYPGYFLRQTEGKIILTELLNHIFENKDMFIEIESVDQLVKKIQNIPFYFDEIQHECRITSETYFGFQKRWKEMISILSTLEIPFNLVSSI